MEIKWKSKDNTETEIKRYCQKKNHKFVIKYTPGREEWNLQQAKLTRYYRKWIKGEKKHTKKPQQQRSLKGQSWKSNVVEILREKNYSNK